jgi:hypothetical protein
MKLKTFSIEGWDFHQHAYAVKWFRDNYGEPKTLTEVREKYLSEKKAAPPTLEEFYDQSTTKKLIADMLGELLGQGEIEIKLNSDKEPKNGN